MRGVNKVIIVGNTGNDPEVSQFQNGGSVATIAVATSEKYQNKQTGEWVENTEWHRVKALGKLAEIIAQYVRKGTPIYIEGKLKTDKYTDKNGIERYATNIVADQMQMLGGNQNAQQNNGGYQQQNNHQQPQPNFNNNMQGEPKPSTVEDDIPFNALNGQLAHLI